MDLNRTHVINFLHNPSDTVILGLPLNCPVVFAHTVLFHGILHVSGKAVHQVREDMMGTMLLLVTREHWLS